MGMRGKIAFGFLSLAVLLLFAGAVSMYELNRGRAKTQEIIELSIKSSLLTENMLDAVEKQNVAVLRMIVSNDTDIPDKSFYEASKEFDKALSGVKQLFKDTTDFNAIQQAEIKYHNVVNSYTDQNLTRDMEWFLSTYLDSYHELDSAIKTYLISPKTSLAERTTRLERNTYKSITPSILTLLIAMLIVLMFYFFIDMYYVRPVLKINKGLRGYLQLRIPFSVSFEGDKEIEDLKEMIEELISKSKK